MTAIPSVTLVVGKRSAAAILAALGLLKAHADDGYESPWILEVGEVFTDCAPLTPAEIGGLELEIAGAFE